MTLKALVPLVAVLLSSCSSSNNLVLGRVQAEVGGHPVVVTDCYRLRAPQPTTVANGAGGAATFRYVPCKDAEVIIAEENLTVNGRAYGKLKPNDRVVVDHGRVFVQSH